MFRYRLIFEIMPDVCRDRTARRAVGEVRQLFGNHVDCAITQGAKTLRIESVHQCLPSLAKRLETGRAKTRRPTNTTYTRFNLVGIQAARAPPDRVPR